MIRGLCSGGRWSHRTWILRMFSERSNNASKIPPAPTKAPAVSQTQVWLGKESVPLRCRPLPLCKTLARRAHAGWSRGLASSPEPALSFPHEPQARPQPPFLHLSLSPASLSLCADIVVTLRPDEKAIMTYVSCFYHAFSGAQKVSWGREHLHCCGRRLTLANPRPPPPSHHPSVRAED